MLHTGTDSNNILADILDVDPERNFLIGDFGWIIFEIKINFIQDNLNILMENPMAIIQIIDTLYSKSDYKYRDKILNKVYLAAFKLC